jgi:hypothetical protein
MNDKYHGILKGAVSEIQTEHLTSRSVQGNRYTELLDNVIVTCSTVLGKTTEISY